MCSGQRQYRWHVRALQTTSFWTASYMCIYVYICAWHVRTLRTASFRTASCVCIYRYINTYIHGISVHCKQRLLGLRRMYVCMYIHTYIHTWHVHALRTASFRTVSCVCIYIYIHTWHTGAFAQRILGLLDHIYMFVCVYIHIYMYEAFTHDKISYQEKSKFWMNE